MFFIKFKNFLELWDDCEWMDLQCISHIHTWSNNRDPSHIVLKRLDHIMVSLAW